MRIFKKSTFFQLAILLSVIFLIQACGEDRNIRTGPDFSLVPDPYDIAQADTNYTIDGGVEIYVVEEGSGPFEVIVRDQISLKYTGRIEGENTIFESTFANGNEEGIAIIQNLRPVNTNQQPPQIEGFRRGLLGMKEGEKRVIIVPPSLGYSETRPGTNGFNLVGETLRYDVEVTGIE